MKNYYLVNVNGTYVAMCPTLADAEAYIREEKFQGKVKIRPTKKFNPNRGGKK